MTDLYFCVTCGHNLKANVIQLPIVCESCTGDEEEKDDYDKYIEAKGLCEVCQSYRCFCL